MNIDSSVRPESGYSPPEDDPITGADPTYSNDMTRLEHKLLATSGTAITTVTTGRFVFGEKAYILPALYTAAVAFPAVLLVGEPRLQAGAAGLGMAALCRLIDKGKWMDCGKYGLVVAGGLYAMTQFVLPYAKKVGYVPY